MTLRCLLGFHQWVYHGPQKSTWTTGDRFGYEHWNVECGRCKRRGWSNRARLDGIANKDKTT